MKTFAAVWTFGWVLVIIGEVNSANIAYAGRSALLSYSPARGEFPVQSLFGRGYFSYIDENGISRSLNLEPNPLLGVRVDADGQPKLETGDNIDLAKASVTCEHNRKHDRLKPIKEFDEKPFVDSLDEINVLPSSTYAPDSSRIVSGKPGYNPSDSNKGSSFGFVYPPSTVLPIVPSVPTVANPGQILPNRPATGVLNPGNPFLPPRPGQILPNPSQPISTGTAVINPSQPANSGSNFPRPGSSINIGTVVVNPSQPASSGQVYPNPSAPINSETFLPSSSQAAHVDIVFPNSPLLPDSGQVYPNPPQQATVPNSPLLPGSGQIFPNQPQLAVPPNSGSTIIGILVPGRPSSPSSTTFPSPPPASVFQSPSLPVNSQGVLQSPSPSWTGPAVIIPASQFNVDKNNPFFTNVARDQLKPEIPPIMAVQPTAANLNLDSSNSQMEMLSASVSSITLEGDKPAVPEQVKDTPEVEQAKREHFLAHQLALERLEITRNTSDQGVQSTVPLASASENPSVYLMADGASAQNVASEPSNVLILEKVKVAAPESDVVLQASPVAQNN